MEEYAHENMSLCYEAIWCFKRKHERYPNKLKKLFEQLIANKTLSTIEAAHMLGVFDAAIFIEEVNGPRHIFCGHKTQGSVY